MKKIKEILIKRDNMTPEAADELIEEAQEAFHAYLDEGDLDAAENICSEFFGLEPDYIDEFI